MPLCGATSWFVLAMQMPQSLTRPLEHQTFWPVMTYSSPSRSARVVSDARSDPAPGSLNN